MLARSSYAGFDGMKRARLCSLLFAMAGVLTSVAAAATPVGSTVSLGPNASATRTGARCGRSFNCSLWRVDGFSLADRLDLRVANDFAVTRTGRIVAATARDILYTDNRGATWNSAHLADPQSPLALAFESDTDEGIAVGTYGSVWTSSDAGASWRSRRDGGAENLVAVGATGSAAVVVGQSGTTWVTFDGGTSIRELFGAGQQASDGATFVIRGHGIWVFGSANAWRVEGGSIEVTTR